MTLEQRLQRLEDDRAIRDLKSLYLRGCDTKNPQMVAGTLLPDATIAYEGFPIFHCRKDFIAIYETLGCEPAVHDIHHAANGIITFSDPDRATGAWSLLFHQVNLLARSVTQFGVEYQDVYVKREHRWWIAETRTTRKSRLVEAVQADGMLRVMDLGDDCNTSA